MAKLREYIHKIPLFIKIVSLYVAVLLPLYFLVLRPVPPKATDTTNAYISHIVAIDQAPALEPATVTGTPVHVRIPRLGIDLPVEPGTYDAANDSWVLSRNAVHYATMTSLPNTASGNTLLYGHNNRRILGATRTIEPNDELQLLTKEGQTFTYRYVSDVKVDPTDTNIFGRDPESPHLTLLTCDGLWNEKRRLMDFVYTGVSL